MITPIIPSLFFDSGRQTLSEIEERFHSDKELLVARGEFSALLPQKLCFQEILAKIRHLPISSS